MKRILSCVLAITMAGGLVACSGSDSEVKNYTVSYDGIATGDVSSGVSVHDPSILEVDGTYYIYGSHMTCAKSDDLLNWQKVADGYSKTNSVYGQIYDVADKAFAYSGNKDSIIKTDDGKTHVWAPDVIYNETMKKYVMYYCTTSTFNASNLCFGISDSPEGPFEWQGALIYSGFTNKNIANTDVLDYVDETYAKKNYIKGGAYNYEDYPNAIDPTIFYDKDGRMWMTYGSWSGGIYLLELDSATGKVIHPEADEEKRVDAYFGKKLLGGGHISIEGPYIMYDANTDYYYLFVSYGGLTSNGGYQMRVFRSKTVDGDYVDMNDTYPEKSAMHQNFGLKLSGNYKLPSLEKAYMATGHNSAFVDSDGKEYIVYHTRFNDGGEGHSPRVHQVLMNEEGWPCELPYQTQGETVSESGYDKKDVVGRYFVVNQGTDISSDIANPIIVYLNNDGSCEGKEVSGKWEMKDGTYYMTITIDGQDYSGAFCQMKDEAGTDVMTFSAVGNNQSVWGVMYVDK
ncbi:arabinan endo-1,5-alpha-L-arabinosidase [Pseudobutyrivibrio sp. UC1225]|uniref:glycoside hydrolase family 43 protein n=1 Tax=Pseudobutyrivibrio sp. UC1225 TaxID=1798185 RepID=UPI0008E203CF|nr:glycoside hydrolase family 43 protein [Pseudobutyrivibrio sp. UC1225]SFO17296.1 arabinan endo-1,5-alpha-L-arabinosidase [Pseudobutyrivibrio sp. UC1225]